MIDVIKSNLSKHIPKQLVDELVDGFVETKKNYYLGGFRLSGVEGGRFCEAAFRILEEQTTGKWTPFSKTIDTNNLIQILANLPRKDHPDSIRIHIPRALRVIYDIRNNRDVAHLADGIDPNLQDATLIASVIDWVLAELIRLYHTVPPNEAQKIVETVVTRLAPAIQDIGGFLKVLNPRLAAGNHLLLLLYQRGMEGASYEELQQWTPPRMKVNLRRTLSRLVYDLAYVHSAGSRNFISRSGQLEVERKGLYELSS